MVTWKNGSILISGDLLSIIGDFTTILAALKGKPIKKWHHYINRVHHDVVYGDCFAFGEYKGALELDDVKTENTWV